MLVIRGLGVLRTALLARGLTGLVLLISAAATRAADIQVPAQQPTIQAGIDAASDGDTVIVANGTYTGVGNRDIDFSGKAITLRSAGGAANCIIDCQGSGRGFFFHMGETADSVLQGFTIMNGNPANSTPAPSFTWPPSGGGMAIDNSSPTLLDCVIANNTAVGTGGGVFMAFSTSTITNCVFTDNSCTASDSLGGGLSFSAWSRPVITGCSFIRNSAGNGGGAMSLFGSSSTFLDCRFVENVAYAYGGGCLIRESPNATVTNCVFLRNDSLIGGGIFSTSDTISVTNCTILDNTALPGAGGGLLNGAYAGAPVGAYVTNCIVRGNVGDNLTDWGVSPISASYSNIQGGYAGVGNIDADPLFVNAAADDYQLLPGSPCVNTGLNSAVTTATDLNGNLRILGGTVDMGAFEAEPSSLKVEQIRFKRAGINQQVKFIVRNEGTQAALDARLTAATLGGVGPNQTLPLALGTIPPGGSISVTLIFRVPAGTNDLTVLGSSSLGSFRSN